MLTLALGIGANTSIFTLLDAVLFKPLDLPAPQDLFTLYERPREGSPDVAGGTGRYLRFSYPRFQRLRQALGDNGLLAATTRTASFVVRLPRLPQSFSARGQLVSGSYFEALGVDVARGRALTEDDLREGAATVVVVSDGFWKRVLAGSTDTVGQTIDVRGLRTTIVGIAPAGFGGLWTDSPADLWLPATAQHALHYHNNVSSYGDVDGERPWPGQDGIAWLNLVARVPAPNLARARAAMGLANQTALADLGGTISDARERLSIVGNTLVLQPVARGFSGLRTGFADALFALGGIVAVVLLAACTNIANLLVARSNARARETAIRLAIGASRRRLWQLYMIECLLLALAGGIAGWMVGQWASDLLASTFLNTTVDRLPAVFNPGARVLAFTAAVSIGAALVFGLIPAIRATRSAPAVTTAGTRTASGTPSSMRAMRPLVAAQLALAFVVMVAAVLLGRTLVNFARLNPGFVTEGVVMVAFNAEASGYSPEQMTALNERLVSAVQAVPGVTSAAVSMCGLLASCSSSSSFWMGDRSGALVQTAQNFVGPGYFATTGIAVLQGREFTEQDRENTAPVAVISASMARKYFAGQDPVGRYVGDTESKAEIVGVAADVRSRSLREPPVDVVYFPIQQVRTPAYDLAVRTAGDASLSVGTVRDALRRSEPTLVLDRVEPMAVQIRRNVLRERTVAYLATALGGVTLLLGCLGLYGVLSYAVGRRSQEFGIRLALGASPADLTRMLFHDALRMLVSGTLAGVVLAWWANRLVQSLLFDVTPTDFVSGIVALALLIAAALAACYLPAMRASRIDPAVTLRAE